MWHGLSVGGTDQMYAAHTEVRRHRLSVGGTSMRHRLSIGGTDYVQTRCRWQKLSVGGAD